MKYASLNGKSESRSSGFFLVARCIVLACLLIGVGVIVSNRSDADHPQTLRAKEDVANATRQVQQAEPIVAQPNRPAEEQHETELAIRFGDLGKHVFKRRDLEQLSDFPVASNSMLSDFPIWSAVARNGDGPAAYALHELISSCLDSYPDEATLNSAISKLYSQRTTSSPGNPDRYELNEDLSSIEASMKDTFEYCDGFQLSGEESEPDFWLAMSADAGFLQAQNQHGLNLVNAGRQREALHYFEMAWQSGSRQAPEYLSALYKQGGPGFEADPILATAFAFLHNGVFQNLYVNEQNGPIVTRYAEQLSARVEQELNLLRPNERELALRTALELLAANDECCFDR